jgi:hypothetical protein
MKPKMNITLWITLLCWMSQILLVVLFLAKFALIQPKINLHES